MSVTARFSAFFFLCLLLLGVISLYSPKIYANGNLENARDVINMGGVLDENVEHVVTFTLPFNSPMVTSTDYINIQLTHFTNITAPTMMDGGYLGHPQFSVEGNVAKVTGVVILPGSTVNIIGIKATNPAVPNWFEVILSISEDSSGNIIKNYAKFIAATFGGTVSLSATINPAVSSLLISGYTAPATFVTFTDNGTVIGTDTAGINGAFSKYFTGIDPTTHIFTLYGVDSADRTTSLLNVTINTPIYQQTTISDLLLSPTIEIDNFEIIQGVDLVVLGSTIPNGDISTFTDSPLRTYYSTASAQGNWTHTINDTSEYLPGDYHIYSLVHNDTGSQSLFSNTLQFTVLPSTGPTPSPAACDISHGDLNCDTHVNLNDFSIMMYYWGSNAAAADINSDNYVNLTDFSIMMYYWGT